MVAIACALICVTGALLRGSPTRVMLSLPARGHAILACAGADDDAEGLRKRIAESRAREAKEMQELQSRMVDIVEGDAQEVELYRRGFGSLPVVCLDALLPRQQLEVDTEDPTFCCMLRDLGLGGLFVMTSLNPARRMLRRSGVVVRIALVDARRELDGAPTAVRASLCGRRRVRISGSGQGLTLRVGRFRKGYDVDSILTEAVLGWGPERFVDRDNATVLAAPSDAASTKLPAREWTSTDFVVLHDEDEAPLYEAGSACEVRGRPAATAGEQAALAQLEDRARQLSEALDRWLLLAREPRTYDDVRVVAGVRVQRGEPGLRVDPDRLLGNVLDSLGPRPPLSAPTALAFWAAALINPLPALGVARECRGAVLEASNASDRLRIVQRVLDASIANLEGKTPLM